ncbi:Homeobox-leucine zipper protein HOX15 [Dendrobium catenatum]|uniref:Homeobox-leucine zipper protein HOX15 n=1 Tax=Dendrobium catenatum TaxID=906689 RepID=A0A2I0W2G9_9ASPA|nr:Homeobox-leucine zipper protein HOX15 [Dendrobium catenatum]
MEQSALLEDKFKEHSTLNPKQKQMMAKQLNLKDSQIEVWFQNERASSGTFIKDVGLVILHGPWTFLGFKNDSINWCGCKV